MLGGNLYYLRFEGTAPNYWGSPGVNCEHVCFVNRLIKFLDTRVMNYGQAFIWQYFRGDAISHIGPAGKKITQIFGQ